MQAITHLSISWLVGCRLETRRDRVLVAWAGVVPDLDALTVLGGRLAFANWHHVLTHGILAALATTAICAAAARRRAATMLLALAAFHAHLLCDFFGSGYDWTIRYWYPFSPLEISSPLKWNLESWPNFAITLAALAAIAFVGIRSGHTFVETLLPAKIDAALVKTLRRRFAPGSIERESNSGSR